MNPVILFRVLILTSLTAVVAALVSSLVMPRYVSADWVTLLEWDGDGGLLDNFPTELPQDGSQLARWGLALGVMGLFLFMLGCQFGLLFFRRFARTGFLATTVFGVVLTPFLGLSVTTPMENGFLYLAGLCDGAALALAYFSPLNERFLPGCAVNAPSLA